MTIKNALNLAKSELGEELYLQGIFILCELLQKDRTWLFLNTDFSFCEDEFLRLLREFKNGTPFEYLFEKASFAGLDFKAKKGVLIPRYDSEILLQILLNLCRKKEPKNILEIGFGSGILSIVLAKNLGLKITACDISVDALNLALQNAKAHGVADLIDFRLCDFRQISGEFDLIFSNPPYIKNDYKLDIWVQSEPKAALFGGVFGYEILADIIEFSLEKNASFLACEFGYDQKQILSKLLANQGFEASFFKDEQGFDRAFLAKRNA